MIAKLSTGNGFGGATSYLLRNGKSDEERAKVKVLAAVGVDYSVNENGNIVLDSRQVARDFRFQSMMKPSVRKPVYDIALSWKVGEHVPSDEKLARTEEFLQMIGFGNTQYIIVEHEKDNEHSHAIANIVDNDGNRISTKDLIDRMHAAAREITKKYGYQWGDTAKKETIEKAHKPHEKARYSIEPTVKEAVNKANDIRELPSLLKPSGIGCNIKYSEAGKPGISFSVELDGQLHTFRGRDLDRSLSAGNIIKTLAARKAEQKAIIKAAKIEKTNINKFWNTYNSHYKPLIDKLQKSIDDTMAMRNYLYEQIGDCSFELKTKYDRLHDIQHAIELKKANINKASTSKGLITALAGLVTVINPVAGLILAVVGRIIAEGDRKAAFETRRALYAEAKYIRRDIERIKEQQTEYRAEDAEFKDALIKDKVARTELFNQINTLKEQLTKPVEPSAEEKHDNHIQDLKRKYPFKDPGHIMYIVHSRTDASIFHSGDESEVFRKHNGGGSFDDDRIEAARCMLQDKGYFVASDREPDGELGFYEMLLNKQKSENYRIGSMYIQPDGKITFGKEEIFGDAEKTAPALTCEPEPVRPSVAQNKVNEQQPMPADNPGYEIVEKFSDGVNKFRIKKESDGTHKLQHYDWDTKTIVNGKATRKTWHIKARFTSYAEIGRDRNYLYLEIQDVAGNTRYINQYGKDLSQEQLRRLGIGKGKGYGGPA